jgi:hypothetical protein
VFNHVKAAWALLAACSRRGGQRNVVASRRDSVLSSNDRGGACRTVDISFKIESCYYPFGYVISVAIRAEDSADWAFIAIKAGEQSKVFQLECDKC